MAESDNEALPESNEVPPESNEATPESQDDNELERRKLAIKQDLEDPLTIVERVYWIWACYGDFHLSIISPYIPRVSPARIIMPEPIPNSNDVEFVYPIHDFGDKLSASKATEFLNVGTSMCKLYYTIEKMICILIARLKEDDSEGGRRAIDAETEVQVAFGGHQLCQRKAFESIINLNYNVVVTNFDPGTWGEQYLQNVKRIADKGYGYPPESPRQPYLQHHSSSSAGVKR